MALQSAAEVEGGGALGSAQRETETLYAVIKTVSSSLDLDRVLSGIVEIATDATGCHACFIYFLEGERLALRAASPRYSRLRRRAGARRRRGPGRLGGAYEDARVHPRERDGRPADEVRARARGGALPVDGRRADPRQGWRRDRGGGPAYRRTTRVRRRRAQLPRAHGVAGGRRDRERPALRGDPPPGSDADHATRAEPGPCCGHGARTSTVPSQAGPASCWAPTRARSTASTRRRTSCASPAPTPRGRPLRARIPAAPISCST